LREGRGGLKREATGVPSFLSVPGDSIDIVNHHNYASSGRDAILALEQDRPLQPSLRTLMREEGVDDRPFWLTETGRRTDAGNQQAYYEDVLIVLQERAWVERLLFFHYTDGPAG
jgi:hypothetical protein